MRKLRPMVASLCLLICMAGTALGQSVYGQISGHLTNEKGASVSGAEVTVVSIETGAQTRTRSDVGGYFTLNNLLPDLYQIEVRADGLRTVQSTIPVNGDLTTTVNASLRAGDPNAVPEKGAAESSILKLDRTDVSTFFGSREVAQLPLFDRNLTRLLALVPGSQPSKLFVPPNQNPQSGLPVNIDGQHFSGTAFQLDGTEDRDALQGIVVINPSIDSVREMKVTSQGYNAEFGQSTAGVVTIQTRSGSNAWHGDGYGYRRTSWGQATNPFAPAGVPPGKHEIFGGSMGGPLIKNQLFLFGDYQGTRTGQGTDLLFNVVPEKVRNTCLQRLDCDLSDYQNFIKGALKGFSGQCANPGPYCIPQAALSPAAIAVLSFLPRPNYTSPDPNCGVATVCDNYLASGQETYREDQFDLRSDFNATSTLRLFARYTFGDFRDIGQPGYGNAAGGWGINPNGFAGIARARNQGISVGFTHSLSSKLLTDFRFGYLRYHLDNDAQDYGQIPNIGIKNIFTSDTGNPFASGMPDIEVPQQPGGLLGSNFSSDYLRLGYSSAVNSCNCPLQESEQQFQFVNNWTHNVRAHMVKWGADLRFLQNYRLSSERPPTGYFNFSPGQTGLGLATLLVGEVTSFNRTFSSAAALHAGERQKRIGFYGQDTWRVTPRLTLNYGLRWDIYFPQTVTGSGSGAFLVPDFHNNDPTSTYINLPPSVPTSGNIAHNLTSFGPRFGAAFLLNPSTVMRAGYGRSFDAGYGGALFGIAATQNPPISINQSVTPGKSGYFNLDAGPPQFSFPTGNRFSIFDLATALAGSGAVIQALDSQVRVPTVDSWNLTIQHELSSQMYFELAYVGSKGTHIFTDNQNGAYYDLNQPTLQGLIIHVDQNTVANCRGPLAQGQNYCTSLMSVRSFFQPLPNFDPSLFTVRFYGNNANDNYHSLQTRLHKNFSHGYSFMAHYTWAKGFDYDSNYFRADPSVSYGVMPFDMTHRFVITNIWDLPLGRGKALFGGAGPTANHFLGNWTLSAVTVWRSGLPFTPTYTRNSCAHDTDTGDPCRPNLVGMVHISGNRDQYFTTTGGIQLQASCVVSGAVDCAPKTPADQQGYNLTTGESLLGQTIGPWQRPGAGQIGNAGRGSLRGPGFFQSDIAVSKSLLFSERASLEFRADVFNAFNRVNLGNPTSCVDCSNAGQINSLAVNAFQRNFQFSIRVSF